MLLKIKKTKLCFDYTIFYFIIFLLGVPFLGYHLEKHDGDFSFFYAILVWFFGLFAVAFIKGLLQFLNKEIVLIDGENVIIKKKKLNYPKKKI
ncbi:hypothetical protein [Romboutsia sp.]|uniref:hypothetical protein n=1 Tax=Romboutsia sp. TaxID=1965302 RepID=UPI003F39E25C